MSFGLTCWEPRKRNAVWALVMVGVRLIHFMSDRGCKLPHGCEALCVRQLRLGLAVAPLALAGFCFRPLALSQVERKGDTLVTIFWEARRADRYQHTTTTGNA